MLSLSLSIHSLDLAKSIQQDFFFLICVAIFAFISSLLLYEVSSRPNTIKGVFSVPKEWPIVGHLHYVLDNPALVFLSWAEKYDRAIFQIRLGVRRVVVVNSYNDVVNLWVNHSCQNNSRPVNYTFHGLVSSFQGFTIGSTPASLTFKKKKKVLSERLNKRSIEHHIPLFSNELNVAFRKMMEEATGEDMSVLHHLQYFVLRCVISMAYGIHLDCFGSDMTFAREIITNEADIIRLRSPVSNLQDSVPLLRLLPILTNSSFARNCGVKREKYMSVLYDRLTKGIMQDEDDCLNSIVGKLVIEKCHNLLTDQEIHSICLTLISAGLDNTPLNLNYLLGVFSQPQVGLQYQMNALEEILKNSNGNLVLAWEQSNQPEMVNVYVYALILETLRHFTVLPLSLPRMTTKSIICNNIELPANTQLFMNAYAANHDIDRFDQPFKFCPERWLDRNTNTIKQASRTYQHFSFGAGSRMCAGHNLALREIYMFIVRLLLLFEINTPSTLLMNMDPFKNNRNPRATSFEPQPHYIQLKLRKLPGYERLHDIVTGI